MISQSAAKDKGIEADPSTFHVILNARAGAVLSLGLAAEGLREKFAAAGQRAFVDASDDDFHSRIDRALASAAPVVVAAGGDGTATTIARRLVGSGKALAVLPLGTANLLARDLGLPLDLDAAVEAMATMTARQIDVGEVNGRVFLHKAVIGVIPAIAAMREKIRGRKDLRSLVTFVRYVVRRISHGRRTAVAIASRDTVDRIERVHAIAIANNAYDEGWAQVFHRSRLDAGCLTLYVLKTLKVADVLRLSAKMFAGVWREDMAISTETVRSVTLNAKRSPLAVMIDGEVEYLEPPLRFSVLPGALRVLAPAASAVEPRAAGGGQDGPVA